MARRLIRYIEGFAPTIRALDVTLGIALPWDLPELLRIDRGCYLPAECLTYREMQSLINSDHEVVHVARLNGMPLGYLSFAIERNQDVRIKRIGVCPDNRFRGIGRYMIERILQKRHPIVEFPEITVDIRFLVHERNLPLQRFLRKMGFLGSLKPRTFPADFGCHAGALRDGIEFVYREPTAGMAEAMEGLR